MNPQRFKQVREANGYTQEALAELLNMTVRAISAWEAGDRKPPIDKLETLADLYHVSTDYLLGRANDIAHKNGHGLCEEEEQLLLIYRTLSEEGKFEVNHFAQYASERYKKDNHLPSVETK